MNLFFLSAVVGFALVDFLVVHFVKAGTVGVLGSILAFFVDVNNKLKALINSLWGEVVDNWHEYAILAGIYFLLFGLGTVALLSYFLAGYLALRLIEDAFGK